MSDRKKQLAVLSVLLLVAFAVRAWLVPHRWINPDEGAHLMDGQLLLDGLVPQIDFDSRQPLYVQLTGLAIWILGPDLFMMRYFPLLVTLATGVVVHLIGRELFDWKAGLVAAGLVLLLPFSVLETIHTKMGPLAMLGSAVAVYFLVRARTRPSRSAPNLYLAGLCAGAAFYLRPSTIGALAAILLGVAVPPGGWKPVLRRVLLVVAGVATAALGVSLYYVQYLPLSEALYGDEVLNPATFLTTNLAGAIEALSGGAGSGAQELASSDRMPLDRSLGNILEVGWLSVVLFVAAGAAVVLGAVEWARERSEGILYRHAVPTLWFGFVALAYLYWTVKRGFFPAYFLEMVPPLALLSGAGFSWCWKRLPGDRSWTFHLLSLAALTVLLGALHWVAGARQISRPLYFLISAGVLGVLHLSLHSALPVREHRSHWAAALGAVLLGGVVAYVGPRLSTLWSLPVYLFGLAGVLGLLLVAARGRLRWSGAGRVAFGTYVLVVAAGFLTLSESAVRLDRTYGGAWSPETLRRVTSLLVDHTDRDDTVISGAVIWQFQAGRQTFANMSHPLSLRGGADPAVAESLGQRLRSDPPAAVVMDGYTEQTFLPVLPDMTDLWKDEAAKLRHIRTFEGSRLPVEVYVEAVSTDPPVADPGE